MESVGHSKKRSSLGKNHQAEIIDRATATNNERDMTSVIPNILPNYSDSGLEYLYTNADQLLNKIEELKMHIADDEPDVIIITEVIPKAQKNQTLC